MTTQQIIDAVKARTRQNDDTKVIREVNSAKDAIYQRVFNSVGGPDLLMTFDNEVTMAAVTREYDIDANVTGTVYALKGLWLKLSGETAFTPMVPMDAWSEPVARFYDQYPSSDTTSVAAGHPVVYQVFNFAKLRFFPMLPSGAVLRIDACIKAPDIDPTSNTTLTYGNDIPEPTHEAIVDKATAQVFEQLNDDRWRDWDVMAERKLNDAMYLMTRRTQGPTVTTPYRRRGRVWI